MSTSLTVPQKQGPILLGCDVLVVGAGMSGFAATEAVKLSVPVNRVDVMLVQDKLRRAERAARDLVSTLSINPRKEP